MIPKRGFEKFEGFGLFLKKNLFKLLKPFKPLKPFKLLKLLKQLKLFSFASNKSEYPAAR